MNWIDRVLPVPHSFEKLPGEDVVLGKPGKSMYRIITRFLPEHQLAQSAVELLRSSLNGILFLDASDPEGSCPITLTMGRAPSEVKNPEQAYLLEVTPEGVTVTGFGVPGLYYGIVTLKQCLRLEQNKLKLPCMRILDWPDLATRGHFMESRYGSDLMTLDDWKHVVDHMANMKMNQLVISVYGCWTVQYDGKVSEYLYVPIRKYPELKTPVFIRYFSPEDGKWMDEKKLPPMFEQDFLGELIAYGKSRGITVFPLFNSYGHNTLIPATYPEVSAKDENGEASLTGFCTSNFKTYEVLFSIYDEIIDRYLAPNHIESFHVGLDEVHDGLAQNEKELFKMRSPWCKCEKCRDRSRNDLFLNHVVKLLSYLKKRGMKNVYMYHDMLFGQERDPEGDLEEVTCEAVIKALKDNDLLDVAVIDWWNYSSFEEKLAFKTTRPEMGLRCVIKPWNGYFHWTVLTSSLQNIYLLAMMGIRDGVEGMLSYSAWDESYDRNHFCQANYSWNFKGTGTTEQVTDHYVRHHFTAQFDKARRAFELMDLITENRNNQYKDGTPVISYGSLMERTLSYYRYSYVNAGKPYPRVFPGEALSIVNENRKDTKRALHEIACMAREAMQLFDEVALDPQCNGKMAARYAYEANNYLCLAEDYLALLHMMNISASTNPDKFEKIREAACSRKLARLALMSRLQKTKESFLMASHMRNHSIFMQFFADLEGYIASGDPSNIKLDFFDMRYLESEAFKKLR